MATSLTKKPRSKKVRTRTFRKKTYRKKRIKRKKSSRKKMRGGVTDEEKIAELANGAEQRSMEATAAAGELRALRGAAEGEAKREAKKRALRFKNAKATGWMPKHGGGGGGGSGKRG